MRPHKTLLRATALAALLLTATLTLALGEGLGQTKEELQLDYNLEVADHGTGRVTIVLTINDQGRLKPLSAVQLVIPNHETADGSGTPDLSIALETQQQDGKLTTRAHLLKDWAKRAHLQLNTAHLDGQTSPLTWYYHTIPIAPHLPDNPND